MRLFQSFISMVFVFLVLASSTSFMITAHLCCGKIQSFAFLNKTPRCEKKMPFCHCYKSASCCEDETIIHNSQDFNKAVSLINTPAVAFIAATASPTSALISEIIPSPIISYNHNYSYDPPLRSSDLTIVLQVLLI